MSRRESEAAKLGRQASALITQARASGAHDKLDRAIELAERAIATCPADDPELPLHYGTLASALQTRFQFYGSAADLDAAIRHGRIGLDACTPHHQGRFTLLANLSLALLARSADDDDVTGAITTAEQALALLPAGHHLGLSVSNTLVSAILARFEYTQDSADLDRAEEITLRVIDQRRKKSGWVNYAAVQGKRYQLTGDADDLEAAIAAARRAVRSSTPGDREWVLGQGSLATLLSRRFDSTSTLTDLNDAITACTTVLSAISNDHPKRADILLVLANIQHTRYTATRSRDDLAAAVTAQTEAVALTSAEDPERPNTLATLASWTRDHDPSVDDGISALEDAVTAAPANGPIRASAFNALSNALRQKFIDTGEQTHIEQAVEASRQAVRAQHTQSRHPDRALYLHNHGVNLRNRFEAIGVVQDIEEAVRVSRKAVALSAARPRNLPGFLISLGFALQRWHDHTGQLTHLQEALTVTRRAVSASPARGSARVDALTNLSFMLRAMFQREGDRAHLEEAVDTARSAAGLVRDGDNRGVVLVNLAVALVLRQQETGNDEEVAEVLDACRRAVDESPHIGEVERRRLTSNLGSILLSRYQLTQRINDLEASVTILNRTLASLPEHHTETPGVLANLGSALHLRYTALADPADLTKAVTMSRRALALMPADHVHREHCQRNLELMLRDQPSRGRSLLSRLLNRWFHKGASKR